MGRKSDEAAQMLVQHYGIKDQMSAQQFAEQLTKELEDILDQDKLLPGVEKLLHHCKQSGIAMGVATSSSGERFVMKTAKHKELFDEVFDVIVTGDDVTQSKPHPEIFHRAAQLVMAKRGIQCEDENVLVFEDAVLGVEAGLAANMKVVMVNDLMSEPPTDCHPHQFLKSMKNFIPEAWGLPAYANEISS